MRFVSRFKAVAKGLDVPRVIAVALVLSAHVALLLVLHASMRAADARGDDVPREPVLAVEFLPDDRAASTRQAVPTLARVVAAPRSARRERSPAESNPTRSASTSAVFLHNEGQAARSLDLVPRSAAADVFDPPPEHKPFAQTHRLLSNLPKSVAIRLPDRTSLLQRYWAVPEGENLQGRAARKVPLLGLLLVATGAIGGPVCPPKSEHPDCLRRLIEDADP